VEAQHDAGGGQLLDLAGGVVVVHGRVVAAVDVGQLAGGRVELGVDHGHKHAVERIGAQQAVGLGEAGGRAAAGGRAGAHNAARERHEQRGRHALIGHVGDHQAVAVGRVGHKVVKVAA